jgi:hypothetical protein
VLAAKQWPAVGWFGRGEDLADRGLSPDRFQQVVDAEMEIIPFRL